VRYEVYTLRRTATRTVYAVYDNLRRQPVCKPNSETPLTTRDRDVAKKWARELNAA
jgi:hypothetical protein